MNVYQTEDMAPAINLAQTPMGHFTAIVSLDTLNQAIIAVVCEIIYICLELQESV